METSASGSSPAALQPCLLAHLFPLPARTLPPMLHSGPRAGGQCSGFPFTLLTPQTLDAAEAQDALTAGQLMGVWLWWQKHLPAACRPPPRGRKVIGLEEVSRLLVHPFLFRASQAESRGGAAVLDAGYLAVGPAGSWNLPDPAALPVPGGGPHLPCGPAYAQLLVSPTWL